MSLRQHNVRRLEPPLPMCERCKAEPLTTTRRLCNYCWVLTKYEREEAAAGVPLLLKLREWRRLA